MKADLDELRRLRRARDRMDREYAEALDVAALARTALMSTAHFSRRFREAYSETPTRPVRAVARQQETGMIEQDRRSVVVVGTSTLSA